jgi:hypothetical protein
VVLLGGIALPAPVEARAPRAASQALSEPALRLVRAKPGGKIKPLPVAVNSLGRPETASQHAATADIQVTYTGFTAQAQATFEAAVSVWQSLIVSPQIIRVDAEWKDLTSQYGPGVLGAAGPYVLLGSDNRLYPAALGESLCGCNVTTFEIEASFNSTFEGWYQGADGNAASNQYDFFSVVLHEIGHGLGFMTSFDVYQGDGLGYWGFWYGGAYRPYISDQNVWSAATSGQHLLTAYPSANNVGSTALRDVLTSNSLYLAGANVEKLMGGRTPLHAPSTWRPGSSGSHLGETTWSRGHFYALMTPFIAGGEVLHHPGALTLAALRDMGYTVTSALAACTTQPFIDVETTHPFCAEIRWMRDTGISEGLNGGTEYRPNEPVTRMAMSAFMARLAGATLTACTTAPFTDVSTSHAFCEEIKWMKEAGISTGFNGATEYRPDEPVTRMAMAAFMARLAGATLTACTTAPFTDVSTSHPFCEEIKWMKGAGISNGFSGGTQYRPAEVVTRQAMSAFMARLAVGSYAP